MAKQNVTFIERHAEKFVIGVCGLVLLVAAYLYMIDTPHTVDAGGEPVGPKVFYAKFRQQGEDALRKMRDARPTEAPVQNQNIGPDLSSPLSGLPPEIPVALVAPGLTVPDLKGPSPVDAVPLVDILPPSKPVLVTGKSSARLPDPIVSQAGVDIPAPPSDAQPQAVDRFWLTAVAAVERKKQRALFEEAHYMTKRQALIVAMVEAQRQERLPTGEWSPAEVIQGYSPRQIIPPANLELVQEEGGFYRTTPEGAEAVARFRASVETLGAQDQILRPLFQPYLTDPYEWAPPRKLEGYELDVKEFGAVYQEEASSASAGGHGPARPGPMRIGEGPLPRGEAGFERPARRDAPGTGDPAQNAMVQALNDLKEAQKYIDEKKFIEAEQVLTQLLTNPELPKPQQDKAQALLSANRAEIDQAHKAVADKERIRAAQLTLGYGQDVEPLWVNDVTVLPGKTYRYRLRLVAVNQYAGMPSYLKNPLDAAKVVLAGAWSDWSEPKVVKSNKRIFFTGVKEDTQTARLEIHQWADGTWSSPETIDLTIGQPVATNGKKPFSYDAIVATIDFHHPFSERMVSKKDGSLTYTDRSETQAITLIRLDGAVEERIAARDVAEKRDFNKEKQEEAKRRLLPPPVFEQRVFEPQQNYARPLGGMDGPGGMRGRGRGFEEGP